MVKQSGRALFMDGFLSDQMNIPLRELDSFDGEVDKVMSLRGAEDCKNAVIVKTKYMLKVHKKNFSGKVFIHDDVLTWNNGFACVFFCKQCKIVCFHLKIIVCHKVS